MVMDKELNAVLEKKFLCPSKFAQDIEKLVHENDSLNYIEAIIVYCDQNTIELESVPKLLSKPLKEKLKYDAQELNFLKRTSRAKLPIQFHKSSKKNPANFSPYYFFSMDKDDHYHINDLWEDMDRLNALYEELMWEHDVQLEFKADYDNNRIIIQPLNG